MDLWQEFKKSFREDPFAWLLLIFMATFIGSIILGSYLCWDYFPIATWC